VGHEQLGWSNVALETFDSFAFVKLAGGWDVAVGAPVWSAISSPAVRASDSEAEDTPAGRRSGMDIGNVVQE
jgi:hypothetical protein